MRPSCCLFLVPLLFSVGRAQSLVTPIGVDFMAGTASNFDWDESRFRLLVSVDSSQFPWGDAPFTIQALRLRRSVGIVYGVDSHRKTSSVVISLDGSSPLSINQQQQAVPFDAQHGANARTLFAGNVDFPCHGRLSTNGVTVPFVVTYPLSPALVVPRGTSNLVIEFQVIENPMTPGGQGESSEDWPVDAEVIDPNSTSSGDRGSVRRLGDTCPPKSAQCGTRPYRKGDIATRGLVVNQSFSVDFASDSSLTCGCAALGPVLSQAIVLPNGCHVYVDPQAIVVLDTDFDGVMRLSGQVPNLQDLAGVTLGCQFAVLGPWPEGFGTSPGLEITVGSGLSRRDKLATLFASVDANTPLPTLGSVGTSMPVIEFVGN